MSLLYHFEQAYFFRKAVPPILMPCKDFGTVLPFFLSCLLHGYLLISVFSFYLTDSAIEGLADRSAMNEDGTCMNLSSGHGEAHCASIFSL